MGIDLHYVPVSGPCRAVMLAAKAVGIELNLKLTDMSKGDHLTPEYIKMNPQHTVPTLDDNGFYLAESRAIMTYLQEKYGKDESWYPKDAKKRAIVDQRLYFDIGVLNQRFADAYYPVFLAGAALDPAKVEKLNEAFKFLDHFLANSEYAAGSNMTLADLSLVATVSTIDVSGHDLSPYKNVVRWYKDVQENAPGYEEANGQHIFAFKEKVIDKKY